MSTGVDIDPAELRAAADSLDTSAQDLADRVDTHMRKVRDFVGVDWTGTAAGSHEEPWADWEEGARRIIASFRADAGLLRQAATEFETTDRSRAESTDAAGSSLDLPGTA
ncbi:WXG100 family type VII secretion target [Nocardia sp. NPDC051030]|uniref:WXG100 family type VII secretion target n=1 Tax=Nocardia sp. NPDC051030 TaxID=3155162 RepID=UPI00344ACE56